MATTDTSISATARTWRQQSRADVTALWTMLRSASFWMILVPGATVLLVWCSQYSVWHSLFRKDFQEIAAPVTLAGATLLALILFTRHRATFTGWLLLLSAALLCRELHFWGTNNGIYAILILLFLYAARKQEAMRPFATNRRVTSLLFGAMWAYVIAKTFDRGYWRRLFPAVEPIRDAFEESIETTGHLLILALVIVAWRLAAKPKPRSQSPGRRRAIVLGSIGLLFIGGAAAAVAVRWVNRDESPSPVRQPGALPYELSSICKVEPHLGENLFLIGSDEFRTLSLCRIAADGEVTLLQDLELKVPLPDGGHCFLDDLEGLAADGAGRYYAVTSHRQFDDREAAKRLAKSHGSERAVVRFELEQTSDGLRIVRPKVVVTDLLTAIRELRIFETVNWRHPKSFRWRHAKASWQIDIEGLAVLGNRLLLGFKNPVEAGKATILALNLSDGKVSLFARPDFHGQGVLGLHHDPSSKQLVAVTNDPLKGRYGQSCLWVATQNEKTGAWEFGSEPVRVLEDAASTRRKAAGIVRDGDRWIVCFGDDRIPVVRVFPRGAARGLSGKTATDENP